MFGGQAGDGSLTTGDLIASIFKRMGLEVYTYKDFPSRIRGGHTNYVIRAGKHANYGMADAVDCLVAFDVEAVQIHLEEMRPGGFIIFDNSSASEQLSDDLRREDLNYYEVPLGKLAKEVLGLELVRNTISLGVIAKLIGMDPEVVREAVTRVYKRKGEKVVDLNIRAIECGENYVAEHFADKPTGYGLTKGEDGDRLIMMGNDAIGYGALTAGCRFMAGYPITPATDILEWMAKHAPKYGGVVVQAEDELAAINMIIGASFTGVRAMTATSGPGISLMTEGIGLAGSIEMPIVVIECARAGPSTGLPTKTEQSNLNHLIFGGHGEIPRVVLAPGTVEESFYITIDAFNIAEKYQCPVFVLSEQALCQSKATLPRLKFDDLTIDRGKLVLEPVVFGEYKRYEFTQDGVSPRVIPGVGGGMHLGPGLEVHPALDAGDDARGNAVLRKLVELVFAEDDRLEDELSAIDRQIIELEARQCRLTLTQRLLGEDEDRTLILLGDVECVDRDVERLLHRPGCKDDAWDLTVPAEDQVVQVALLRLRRQPGRRSGPGALDDDDRHFDRSGQADPFGHERNPRARGRGHRTNAGKRCTDDHVDRGELVLGLDDDAAVFRSVLGHPLEDIGRRGDRIARHEPAAGGEGAVSDRVVSHHDQPVAVLALRQAIAGRLVGEMLGDVIFTALDRADVEVDDFLAFALVDARHRLAHDLRIHPDQLGDDAERDRVPHELEP